jgi:hypothetical protein
VLQARNDARVEVLADSCATGSFEGTANLASLKTELLMRIAQHSAQVSVILEKY